MEKTLELRVKAILGPEMAKLQRALMDAGMLGTAAGKAAGGAGKDIEAGFNKGNRAAKDFNGTIQNTTKYLQLIKGVISAFLLYRGFSFLTQQASQFMRTLVDVQHEVGIIQTQLRDTNRDYRGDISRNIMKTAAETGMAMESLARTEYEIVSANIKVADSYHVLDLSARAAVAGGLRDAELAFDAALSQVNTFNITFEKAFDLQFQTLKRGIFNYEQFTTVVGTMSEAFASMGQEAETANASLAAISQVFTGKQIERGATGLRNAVLRISEAPEDFQALGVAVTDVNGEFRNFIDIAQDLSAVLAGMSSSQRASVIRNLFPDERERRGIGAFLGQLENAEQFFVEQKFAVDTLNDAYDTANDSLQTQANIFQQDLVPAMQPFVEMMGGLLTIFNGIDGVLPGLNKTLLTTATIGAVIGSGALMSGGRFPMSRRFAGPGFGPMGTTRMPTGIGYGVAGLMGAAAFTSGMQPGRAGAGDYVGSALGGAATGGMVGGIPGAVIGGAVGLIAVALGDALGKQGDPVASSFSDAFAMQLEMRAGGIAAAFTAALSMEIAGIIPPGGEVGEMTLKGKGNVGRTYGTKEQRIQLYDVLRAGGSVDIGGRTFSGPGDVEDLKNALNVDTLYLGGADSKTARANLPTSERNAMIRRNLEDFVAFRAEAAKVAPVEAARLGTTEQEFIDQSTQQALQDIPSDLAVFGRATASGMGLFAEALAEGRVTMDDLDVAMGLLGEGTLEQQKAFLEFLGVLEAGTPDIKATMQTLAASFSSMFIGDAALAADVFERMGTEGERLAEVFTRISQTMQAFSLLQTLTSMTMEVSKTERVQVGTKVTGKRLAGPPGNRVFVPIETPVYENRTTTETVSLLDRLGIDSTAAGQQIIDRLVEDLGLVKGEFSTEDFVKALFAEATSGEVAQELNLGANSLADALFEASDQVRDGLLASATYTADELEMFGEEFKELNRLVRQRAILEELKGIAEFAGVGTGGIAGAMDLLRDEMVSSGKALFDILSDPASLAELIAKMEFGDVQVDNSTTQTIVVRYERGSGGDTGSDIEQAQRIANLIVEEMRKN